MRRLSALVAVLLATATPAFAHVEVTPDTADKGGSATFSFKVEDEQSSANEVTVEIYLPPGLSKTNVRAEASVGWTAEFTDAPSVRFSHAAPGPDGDQSFTLRVDSLPDSEQLLFKTVVTYDNGAVDRWIDEPTGGDEPPHPAAVVKLSGTAPTVVTAAGASPATTVARPDKGSNSAGIAGVIIAAIVVVGGLVVFATRGRRP
jgi:uncharacterized protein YcnI